MRQRNGSACRSCSTPERRSSPAPETGSRIQWRWTTSRPTSRACASSWRTADEFGEFEENPDVLESGFALEYSVPYLQSQVRDVGLAAPFYRLIPLVELGLEKPLNHGGSPMTGTVDPGLIWAGQYLQLAAEAVIPVSHDSGHGPDWRVQLHFFIDDLLPNSLGRPIFGGQ